MERGTPAHLSNNNHNHIMIHGNNAVVQTFNPVVQQLIAADSKTRRLFTLLNPLVSSTRMGSDVPKDGCLAGTRLELLQQISTFASDADAPHVCLILGMAGMGKSAIARSIADVLAKSGLSVATYFISRYVPHSRRAERLVQTLAYQLAEQDVDICNAVLASLDSNPGILSYNIASQVQQLLVAPITSIRATMNSPLTIIIDGLDEADEISTLLSEVVEPVAMALLGLPRRVSLLVSSREFEALRTARSRGALEGIVNVRWLHKIDKTVVRGDIRMFIAAELGRLQEQANLDATWPTAVQIDSLADRADSLFIYAVTVLHFLGENQYSPKTRLEQLFSNDSTTTSGNRSPFEQLDALYLGVLFNFVGTTPLSIESRLIKRLRLVLAAVTCSAEPMSVRMMSGILGIDRDDLEPIIRGLAAIWLVPEDRDKQLQVYHLSFSEFISDPVRCTEPCLCIPTVVGHQLLATACLRKMTQALRRDVCDFIEPGVPLPYKEAYSLGIIQENVDSTLRYACIHGVDTHLARVASTAFLADVLVEMLATFCDEHLLHWVEIRAVFGEESLTNLVRALHRWTKIRPIAEVETWMRASRLFAELHDMVYEFQDIILASPLEIYNVCLALLPSGSLVSTYANHKDVMVQRITSRPDTWLDTRYIASQNSTTTCIVTEGNWVACGFVGTRAGLSVGQSYVLLWPATPTVPFRLDMPHADDFALRSLAFSASASHLVTLSEQPFDSGCSSTSGSFITVWDLVTQRMISLRRVATRILSISFDVTSARVLCVTCDPKAPVLSLPLSLDGRILRPPLSSGWYKASFSADRCHIVSRQLNGALFWASKSLSWRPIMLSQGGEPHSLSSLPPTEPRSTHILTSSDGSVIAASFFGKHQDATLCAWNMACPESPQSVKVSTEVSHSGGVIESPALSRHGRLLAFCRPYDAGKRPLLTVGELRWKDEPQFVYLASWPCNGSMISEFSEDATLIAIIDGLRVLRVWNVLTGHEIARAVENFGFDFSLQLEPMPIHISQSLAKAQIRLPDDSSPHFSFVNAGVISSWNTTRKSHTVLVSPNGNSHRPSQLCRFSQFCYWLAANLAREKAEFATVLSCTPVQAVMQSDPKDRMLFKCNVGEQGSTLFAFVSSNDLLVVVYRDWIIRLSVGSPPTQIFEGGHALQLEFAVDMAELSPNRGILAVADRVSGQIIVVFLNPDDDRHNVQYVFSGCSGLEGLEFNAGNHLPLAKYRQSGPLESDRGYIIRSLALRWPRRAAWRSLSDVGSGVLPRDLSSSVGDLPPFVRNISQLANEHSPCRDLVWRRPILYLNATQGGPMILDFSQHPGLQPAPPEENDQNADPELSGDDQGVETRFSDDDYYAEEEESGDE